MYYIIVPLPDAKSTGPHLGGLPSPHPPVTDMESMRFGVRPVPIVANDLGVPLLEWRAVRSYRFEGEKDLPNSPETSCDKKSKADSNYIASASPRVEILF